jgi:hypothetical protein
MRVTRFEVAALGVTTLLLITLIGCGEPVKPTKDSKVTPDSSKTEADKDSKTEKAVGLRPGKGTLTGTVKLTGAKPDIAALNKQIKEAMEKKGMEDATQKTACLDVPADEKDQTEEQDWKLDGDLVKDVFVYLKPVGNTFFAFEADDDAVKEAKEKPITLKQPHCVFIPHALTAFPKYRDKNNKKKDTEQKLVITNTATVAHNSKLEGQNPLVSAGNQKGVEVDIPDPSSELKTISCSIHTWMNANLLVLEHPYVAVTDAKGNYTIKNVPKGKVQIVVVHPSAEKKTKEKELTEEKNEENFEIKAK